MKQKGEGKVKGKEDRERKEKVQDKEKKRESGGWKRKAQSKKSGNVEGRKQLNIKILFWNVTGLASQDKNFWDYVCGFDIVGMSKTWIEEKGWEKLKGRLPNTYDWECQGGEKIKSRGRVCGGIVIGKRKEKKWEE